MQLQSTKLRGVKLIRLQAYYDERGCFKESFSLRRYQEMLEIDDDFVQDNISESHYGVLRGLHFQQKRPQGKLITVTQGRIFDVVADINPASSTFGQYISIDMSAKEHLQLWVPPGYAHGFCVLSQYAQVSYKCTDYYQPDDQQGIIWNCPTLAIDWPIEDPILSVKDTLLSAL